MIRSARAPGQPLRVLIALAALWVGARALLWQSPFPMPSLPDAFAPVLDAARDRMSPAVEARHSSPGDRTRPALAVADAPGASAAAHPAQPVASQWGSGDWSTGTRGAGARGELLLLASFGMMPGLADLQDDAFPPPAARGSASQQAVGLARVDTAAKPVADRWSADRWSADGWLFLRPGGGRVSDAAGPATYGASQAGAVLRYALAPRSRHRPAAYLRATKALDHVDGALAAGVGARPLAGVPLLAQAEMRLARRGDGTLDVAPALLVASAAAPVDLPGGLRAEGYGQAGYVGGDFPTLFADGQFRLDRRLADGEDMELRTGAGAWAGGQRGAGRLDLGPAASLRGRVGGSPLRLDVDYRLKIAGAAAPGPGLAVTLSAGF